MIKRLSLFTFLFLFAVTNNVLAHTGLKSSSPQSGELITEELQQITLTFETKIEQGSTFALQNSDGESIAVENISLSGDQLVGNLSTSLENGDYQIHWNIIGADGHLIEGDVAFSVELPVTTPPAVEQLEPQEETNGKLAETQEATNEVIQDDETTSGNAEIAEEVQQTETSSNIMPIIIGILIVIVIGSFFFMMKRKN